MKYMVEVAPGNMTKPIRPAQRQNIRYLRLSGAIKVGKELGPSRLLAFSASRGRLGINELLRLCIHLVSAVFTETTVQ